jgi:hypothetical protein
MSSQLDTDFTVLKDLLRSAKAKSTTLTFPPTEDMDIGDGADQVSYEGEGIAKQAAPSFDESIISIDGSSYTAQSPFASVAIATAAVCAEPFGELIDYPPAPFDYPARVRTVRPFLAVCPHSKVSLSSPNSSAITIKSPSGDPYDYTYNSRQMTDEIRTGLENFLLGDACSHVAQTIRQSTSKQVLIVVDGPIYATPPLLKYSGKAILRYQNAWIRLIEERLRSIEQCMKVDVPVVGVVKRIERSRLLVKSADYVNQVKNLLNVDITTLNDQAAITVLIERALSQGIIQTPHKPLVIGPLKAPAAGLGVSGKIPNAPDKVFCYVAIPSHAYEPQYGTFRLETTSQIFDSMGKDSHFGEIVGDTVEYQSLLPGCIVRADNRCGRWAKSIFKMVCQSIVEGGLGLTYSTRDLLEQIKGA